MKISRYDLGFGLGSDRLLDPFRQLSAELLVRSPLLSSSRTAVYTLFITAWPLNHIWCGGARNGDACGFVGPFRSPMFSVRRTLPYKVLYGARARRSLAIGRTVAHHRTTICAEPISICESSSPRHGRTVEREVEREARPTPLRKGRLVQQCYLERNRISPSDPQLSQHLFLWPHMVKNLLVRERHCFGWRV